MTIKSISINSIRGIKELNLDIGEKGAIIYGENGSGKTSIVDSFEFFFTGSISHLTQAKTLSFREYGTYIYKDKEPEVSLTFSDNTKIARSCEKKYRIPKPLAEYFKNAENGKIILRRAQILDFIHEQPSNRYKSFGSLIGLGNLDNLENLFKKANDYLQTVLDDLNRRIQYEYDSLSDLLHKPMSSKEQLLVEINNLPTSKSKSTLNSVTEISKYRIESSKHHLEPSQYAINNLKNTISRLGNFDLDEISFMAYNFDALICNFFEKSKGIRDVFLLQAALNTIEKSHEKKCPVCDQTIDKEALLNELKERVKVLEEYDKDVIGIRESGGPITKKLEELHSTLVDIGRYDLFNNTTLKIHQFTELLDNLKSMVNGTSELKKNMDYSEFDKELQKLSGIGEIIEALEKELEGIENNGTEDSELFDILNQVDDKLFIITKYEEDRQKKLSMFALSSLLYSKYSKVKKREIQGIYGEIQKDTEDYYSFVHPKEDHKNIQLIVDLSKKSNSVDIKMESFQKDVDPRAYQSEGHLDSLGLCVFFAFTKKFNCDCDLLVLDDIVTTIDSNHRNRICELIFEKFPEKQIVITTHDHVWYEQILSTQKMYNIQNKFKNYSINRWNVNSGIELLPYKKRAEVIEEKLNKMDKQGAGNEIRQYLEYVFSEACHKLSVKIPFRKNGKYMLNDYFENFRSRVSEIKLYADAQWKTEVLKIYGELDRHRPIINTLSHYNHGSSNISIDEINEVYRKSMELEKVLSCSNCQTILEYDYSGKFIKCVNQKCKVKTIYQ